MSIRYIHNLFLLHFNVGIHIAHAINDALLSHVSLFELCVARAHRCTNRLTKPRKDKYHFMLKSTYHSEDELTVLLTQTVSLEIETFYKLERFRIRVRHPTGNMTLYRFDEEWDILRKAPTDYRHIKIVSPRQFHWEIERIFERFLAPVIKM